MTRRTPAQYNWTRVEFDETWLKKHYSPLTARRIDYVVVHHMTVVGKDTSTSALDACYNIWQSRQASAHYGVQGEQVRQYVKDKDFAWATGSNAGNLHGISIEHTNSAAGPNWLVSELTMRTGAKLAAALHIAYGLGRPTSNANGTTGTLRQHEAFTSTACPGPFLGGTQWLAYVKEAQKQYDLFKSKGATKPAVPATPSKPAVPAKPVGPTLTVDDSFLNCAAYDVVGQGKKTRVSRADECATLLRSGDPLFIHAVEVDEDMLAKMDAVLAEYKRLPQGGKGRESWHRKDAAVKILEAKRFSLDKGSMLDGDDKPYVVYAWELDGYKGVTAVFHSENETEGAKQKAQLKDVLDTVEEYKVRHGVKWANCLAAGDTNTPLAAQFVRELGWRAGDALAPAASRKGEEYKSFNGWSAAAKAGAKIDVFAVRGSTTVTRFNQTLKKTVSDHNKQYLVRELVK